MARAVEVFRENAIKKNQAEAEALTALKTSARNKLVAGQPLTFHEATVELAVVGAHLEGQPLNWQLLERGARKVKQTRTSAHYRLTALADTVPPKPGLARVAKDGAAIEIEIWEIPVQE